MDWGYIKHNDASYTHLIEQLGKPCVMKKFCVCMYVFMCVAKRKIESHIGMP